MARSNRSKRIPDPKVSGKSKTLPIEGGTDYNTQTPVFCFAHLKSGFEVKDLAKHPRAQFASRLQELSQLTWGEIMKQDRHKYGTELLSVEQLRTAMPAKFSDEDRVTVFRYMDRLPMVGVRVNDVFHVIAVEAHYGDLYDHGS